MSVLNVERSTKEGVNTMTIISNRVKEREVRL